MTLSLEELGLPSEVLVWQLALLTIVSFAAGLAGGFVGLALGVFRLPAMLLLGMSTATAAGTNIAVSTVSLLSGAVRHQREGRVDARTAAVMGLPGMAGALAGGIASGRAPESLLVLAVGLLLVWQGLAFLRLAARHRKGVPPSGGGHPSFSRGRAAAGAFAALVIGLAGGAVGLVLGIARLPVIIRVLRVDPRTAAGTNMFVGFFVGSLGWVGHATGGQVDYPLLVVMGSAAMAGTYSGARLTGRVSRDKLLATMGVVLLVAGPLLLVQSLAR